ncbi:MAG: hypothetical protein CMF96_00125 [Candidatus Marinimicrobia bacterium]|nr:hypothetical protein [Candidatus Neomarinimicrobiota bacterium]
MEAKLILYPTFLMVLLTAILYVKNYFDNKKAYKDKQVSADYFKTYLEIPPEKIAISQQTLKNQFELPIIFYILISILISMNKITIFDIFFAWIFVISRYFHCYVRLSSNFVPLRARVFKIGLLILIIWWVYFIIKISI